MHFNWGDNYPLSFVAFYGEIFNPPPAPHFDAVFSFTITPLHFPLLGVVSGMYGGGAPGAGGGAFSLSMNRGICFGGIYNPECSTSEIPAPSDDWFLVPPGETLVSVKTTGSYASKLNDTVLVISGLALTDRDLEPMPEPGSGALLLTALPVIAGLLIRRHQVRRQC